MISGSVSCSGNVEGVGSCMPLGDGDAGLRRRGARKRNRSNDKAVQRGWRQMAQAHTRTEDEDIIRELIIDFYETSKQRKPQQIIIFSLQFSIFVRNDDEDFKLYSSLVRSSKNFFRFL